MTKEILRHQIGALIKMSEVHALEETNEGAFIHAAAWLAKIPLLVALREKIPRCPYETGKEVDELFAELRTIREQIDPKGEVAKQLYPAAPVKLVVGVDVGKGRDETAMVLGRTMETAEGRRLEIEAWNRFGLVRNGGETDVELRERLRATLRRMPGRGSVQDYASLVLDTLTREAPVGVPAREILRHVAEYVLQDPASRRPGSPYR